MTKEPSWVWAGYAIDAYEAECRMCGKVARLEFGGGEREMLIMKNKDKYPQEYLHVMIFYTTVEMLRRKCTCSPEARKNYTRSPNNFRHMDHNRKA